MYQFVFEVYSWVALVKVLFFICWILFSGVLIYLFNAKKFKKNYVKFFIFLTFLIITTHFLKVLSQRYILEHTQRLVLQGDVVVDGEYRFDQEDFVDAISKLKKIKVSGSRPVKNIDLKIVGEEVVHIRLGRDSNNSSLYWLFYPRLWFGDHFGYVILESK